MSLENDRGMIFVTRRTVLIDHNIVGIVLDIVQAMVLRKGNQIVADLLRIARTVGNAADLFKIVKHTLRLEPGKDMFIQGSSTSLYRFNLLYHIGIQKSIRNIRFFNTLHSGATRLDRKGSD